MNKPTAFGKYYLLERIDTGLTADVFRAKAFGVEGFERLVAVKRILSLFAEDREFIRKFIDQAKLAVQLTHANIAQIFDLGVVDGAYYVALEHVHGRDLRAVLERCRQYGEAMPIAQACFIAMKLCEGLDYAHNKRDQGGRELGLIHRDLSPPNILVSFEGEVKLIDFGFPSPGGDETRWPDSHSWHRKLAYRSPEAARELGVDRRSDIFTCGIVLYELLTGERLFAGDDAFATLAKVASVEILPPSTYNRKIPEELERIVLKALAAEPADRYQHAIDLHDELQAFVYTAGEFCSRKELAAWMKKMFGKEIDEETAKLESYRQLKPPPGTMAAQSQPLLAPNLGPSDAVPEPPRPESMPPSQPIAVPAAAPVRQPARKTGPPAGAPAQARSGPARSASPSKPPPQPARSQPARSQPVPVVATAAAAPLPPGRPSELGWEDDELETRVYDGDDPRHRSNRANLPLQPPVSSSPAIPLPIDAGLQVAAASPSDSWPAAAVETFAQTAPTAATGPAPGGLRNGALTPVPSVFPAGSNDLGPPIPAEPVARKPVQARQARPPVTEIANEPATVPASSFGARITAGRKPSWVGRMLGRRKLEVGLAGLAGVGVIGLLINTVSSKPRHVPAAPPAAPKVATPVPVDTNTGFDLYVAPAGITHWKLDGESRTDRLPSRIRGIAPGAHTVQIEPPPGFLSQRQDVPVEAGKASKIEIALQPIAGIAGVFESAPPGATVSLIVDGKREAIGPSPARAPLDPRSSYQVLFEKPGYVSVNRPIAISGALEEHVLVNLEKVPASSALSSPPSAVPRSAPASESRPRRAVRPADKSGDASPSAEQPAAADTAAETRGKAQGVLVLGSKPPCDIAIDGASTGQHTPQKAIKLTLGRHRITLTNAEFGINETFAVDIKADAPEKLIKDYSDRLPN